MRREYRIQAQGVMLTYSGITDLEQWTRFLELVGKSLQPWGVKYWCATLEKGQQGHVNVFFFGSVEALACRPG